MTTKPQDKFIIVVSARVHDACTRDDEPFRVSIVPKNGDIATISFAAMRFIVYAFQEACGLRALEHLRFSSGAWVDWIV